MEQVLTLKEPINQIKVASDLFKRIRKIKIDYDQENFIMFYLDSSNRLIKSEVLFKGGLNACVIDPKTVFRRALKANANALIIAHNHPSGNLNPSGEDSIIFQKLRDGGNIIQLKVLDSIIFNKDKFYSMEVEI